jgi:hypothetical protein
MDSIVLFWFAGAVGLFFRRRLAWVASLLGVGTSVCAFAVSLVMIVWLYIYPNAEMNHLRDIGGAGYIFALIFGVGQLSILLALSLGLFVGLLKMRKELR